MYCASAPSLHRESTDSLIKRKLQKQKPSCCVPGCDTVLDHTCMFASFDTICTTAIVPSYEPSWLAVLETRCKNEMKFNSIHIVLTLMGLDLILLQPASHSHSACAQHYHTVYKHCNPESVYECALCDSKRRHHASNLCSTF